MAKERDGKRARLPIHIDISNYAIYFPFAAEPEAIIFERALNLVSIQVEIEQAMYSL